MTTESQIEKTFREEHGRVLATLISQLGDFMLAEDALQDALVNALERWKVDGVPRNPGAWLTTVAKRRAIDRLRRSRFEDYSAAIPASLAQEEPEMDVSKTAFGGSNPSAPASPSDPNSKELGPLLKQIEW